MLVESEAAEVQLKGCVMERCFSPRPRRYPQEAPTRGDDTERGGGNGGQVYREEEAGLVMLIEAMKASRERYVESQGSGEGGCST